jgi:fused signal recognition particle receptor
MFKFWKKKVAEKPQPETAEVAQTADISQVSANPSDLTISTPTEIDTPQSAAPMVVEPIETAPTPPIESAEPDAAPFLENIAPEPPEQSTDGLSAESATSSDAPTVAKRSWRERLAGSGFARGLSSLFTRNPKLDDDLLDELETCLISADVGVTAATEIVEKMRKRVAKREFADANALLDALRRDLVDLLKPVEKPLDVSGRTPFVLLMVGVNGVGKTTTIGKLARRYLDEKRSLMLAAGDTFRAAAVEQLQTWGDRNQVPVIAQGSGSDSASVIFDALQAARSRGTEILIADTAGRLHTQTGLMDELGKIRRVLGKLDASAPHEVLMVIDGTTGQNAINQVRHFRQAIGVSGLVVTKLDGTAKGGVVFALAREFGLPIRYVGLGEGIEDLRVFDAQAFVDGVLPSTLAGNS